jgi:amino acid transporter
VAEPSARSKGTLGVLGLTFYGVGMIVGAGVYSVIGAAAGRAGTGVALGFAVGAVVAALTAMSYAELAAMFPRAGAEYVYAREAIPRPRVVAFALGIVLVLAAAGTAATVSLAFAGYLSAHVAWPPALVAGSLIVLLTAVNVAGIRLSTAVNVVLTLAEVAGLAAFVVVGLSAPRLGEGLLDVGLPQALAGAAVLFFAYLGFEDVANLAEEAREPRKDLPRALFLSVGITAVLYVAVGVAAVALMEPARLAESRAPLADAARGSAPAVADGLGVVALLATTNTALIALVAGSRMARGLARGGDLPEVVGTVRGRHGTPWVAALVLATLALSLLPMGGVSAVASLSSFAALLAFVVVNAAVVVLRFRKPRAERPFRVPLAIGRFPVLPALALASAALLLSHFDAATYLGGAIALGATLLAYGVRHLVGRRRAPRAARA